MSGGPREVLTADELYVLQRLAGGARASEIAAEMKLKASTIYALAGAARKKLEAKTIAHACYLFASRYGNNMQAGARR